MKGNWWMDRIVLPIYWFFYHSWTNFIYEQHDRLEKRFGRYEGDPMSNQKFVLGESIVKKISNISRGEYFYTTQPAKQVYSAISHSDINVEIKTKKCLVLDPALGDVIDTLVRVEKL